MFRRIFTEDCESFVILFFRLQLTREEVHLQRSCHVERLLLRCHRIIFSVERSKDSRFRHLVVIAVFVLNRFVGIDQRLIQADLFRQQVVGGIVPTHPRVLGEITKLLFQAGLHHAMYVY